MSYTTCNKKLFWARCQVYVMLVLSNDENLYSMPIKKLLFEKCKMDKVYFEDWSE